MSESTEKLDAAISSMLTGDAEWEALRRQAGTALAKQRRGAILHDIEIAHIEEYEAIQKIQSLPIDYRTGEPMARYHMTLAEAAEAHNSTIGVVQRAKRVGCRAFRARRIYSASLALWLLENPEAGRQGRAGRPSKLTPEVQESICETIRKGNYLQTAARKAGVSRSVLANWKAKGAQQQRGRYREFLDAVEEAEAEGEAELVDRALNESPRGALEILQRRYRERWAPRSEVTGKDGGELTNPPTEMTIRLASADGKDDPWVFQAETADEEEAT